MQYQRGDAVRQPCLQCGKMFDYIYPGKGRPTWHACDDCRRPKYSEHAHVGETYQATCKDCGKTFNYVTTIGRHAERCLSCRPRKVGSIVEQICKACGSTFRYKYRKYLHEFCPDCLKQRKREYNTNHARKSRGAVPNGTAIAAVCAQCGIEFTYTLHGRRRTLCEDCLAADNLPAMEKLNRTTVGWNRKKWQKTLEAFGHRCGYCDKQPAKYHRDHFFPKSLGGISDIGNIVPACPDCNLCKHSKHPAVFLNPLRYQKVVSILESLRDSQFTGLFQ